MVQLKIKQLFIGHHLIIETNVISADNFHLIDVNHVSIRYIYLMRGKYMITAIWLANANGIGLGLDQQSRFTEQTCYRLHDSRPFPTHTTNHNQF